MGHFDKTYATSAIEARLYSSFPRNKVLLTETMI